MTKLSVEDIKEMTQAMTHGGVFHADDVFSSALLLLINPDLKVIRGFKVPDDFSGLVFDIGGGEFDHHQPDAERRPDGSKYAAFGLLWKALGSQIVDEVGAKIIDESIVAPIDHTDNGESDVVNPLAVSISMMNCQWDEPNSNDNFFEAVEIAKKILSSAIKAQLSRVKAKEIVLNAFAQSSDKRIVVLDKFCPWQDVLVNTTAEVVIFPSLRGGYNAQVVPVKPGSFTAKVSFPESWAGLTGGNLVSASGIEGLTFCHAGRFLVAGATKEAVINAAKLIISK